MTGKSEGYLHTRMVIESAEGVAAGVSPGMTGLKAGALLNAGRWSVQWVWILKSSLKAALGVRSGKRGN